MDARVLLRRYLEQRRELGESELVLDSLNVEDVMRLLGAVGKPVASPTTRPSLRELAGAVLGDDVQDWRTSLRDAGVNVDAPKPVPEFVPPTTQPEATKEMAFKKGIVVGAEEAELIPSSIEKLDSLEEIAAKVKKCTRCPLYETATNAVPGEGNPKAELVCVGEAPGAKEDETGRPFVGQAGQLLYAGTHMGVYRSTDGGASWSAASASAFALLPTVPSELAATRFESLMATDIEEAAPVTAAGCAKKFTPLLPSASKPARLCVLKDVSRL